MRAPLVLSALELSFVCLALVAWENGTWLPQNTALREITFVLVSRDFTSFLFFPLLLLPFVYIVNCV